MYKTSNSFRRLQAFMCCRLQQCGPSSFNLLLLQSRRLKVLNKYMFKTFQNMHIKEKDTLNVHMCRR